MVTLDEMTRELRLRAENRPRLVKGFQLVREGLLLAVLVLVLIAMMGDHCALGPVFYTALLILVMEVVVTLTVNDRYAADDADCIRIAGAFLGQEVPFKWSAMTYEQRHLVLKAVGCRHPLMKAKSLSEIYT